MTDTTLTKEEHESLRVAIAAILDSSWARLLPIDVRGQLDEATGRLLAQYEWARQHIAALEEKSREWQVRFQGANALLGEAIDKLDAERERCAKIAEEHAGFCSNTAGQAAAEAIAAAIRKGGET